MKTDYNSSTLTDAEARVMELHCQNLGFEYILSKNKLWVSEVNPKDFFTLGQLELYCILSVV